jgi:hypothetical protein
MAEEVMLTTIDNPYNPFDNFEQWYMFDELQARRENRPTCCSYLARVDCSSDEVSEAEQRQTMNDIIDEIIELNLSGKFIKMTHEEARKLA